MTKNIDIRAGRTDAEGAGEWSTIPADRDNAGRVPMPKNVNSAKGHISLSWTLDLTDPPVKSANPRKTTKFTVFVCFLQWRIVIKTHFSYRKPFFNCFCQISCIFLRRNITKLFFLEDSRIWRGGRSNPVSTRARCDPWHPRATRSRSSGTSQRATFSNIFLRICKLY